MFSKKKIETQNQEKIKILFWRVLAGSKGCINRVKIILELKEQPLNTNQLSLALQLDYKVVERHLQALEKYGLIIKGGDGYGTVYLLSPLVESNLNLLDEVTYKSAIFLLTGKLICIHETNNKIHWIVCNLTPCNGSISTRTN